MMDIKNTTTELFILTDFNKSYWTNVSIANIKESLGEIHEKIDRMGCIFGELKPKEDNTFEMSFSRVSHAIQKIYLDEKSRILYGDINFLTNEYGVRANRAIHECTGLDGMMKKLVYFNSGKTNYVKFQIRAAGVQNYDQAENIHKIFTWDIVY